MIFSLHYHLLARLGFFVYYFNLGILSWVLCWIYFNILRKKRKKNGTSIYVWVSELHLGWGSFAIWVGDFAIIQSGTAECWRHGGEMCLELQRIDRALCRRDTPSSPSFTFISLILWFCYFCASSFDCDSYMWFWFWWFDLLKIIWFLEENWVVGRSSMVIWFDD